MSPHSLQMELREAGRKIAWWRARIGLLLCAAAVLVAVWLAGLLDLLLRYARPGRAVLSGLIWTGCAAAAWWVLRMRGRRFSLESIAAMIEKAFPRLDNRLINYLQFAGAPDEDAFRRAYVERGLPEWNGLQLDEMRDRRIERRANIALAAAVLLLLCPLLFFGRAWGVAVWRVVNPFSAAMPATLAHIAAVTPGDATVLQGSPLVLSASISGRKGQRVAIDVEPSDKTLTTYALGEITGTGVEDFSHRLPKVNSALRYRFRAGDAAFPAWYTIKARPPLAFSNLTAAVTPPRYTGLPARPAAEVKDDLSAPAGASVTLVAKFNLPAKRVTMTRGQTETEMTPAGDPGTWQGTFTADNGAPLIMRATSPEGDRAEQSLRIAFQPDLVPVIDVLAPEGRPVLAAGAAPEIIFEVKDDHGLDRVTIEAVDPDAARDAAGEVLQEWKPTSKKALAITWADRRPLERRSAILAYRIVASDAAPSNFGPRIARSAIIAFNTPAASDAAKQRDALEQEAMGTLARVIEVQRRNIERTQGLRPAAADAAPDKWKETADAQREVQQLTRRLIDNPVNPLGRMAATVKKLYVAEMTTVIPLLAGIPDQAPATRVRGVDSALQMEAKILRQLTLADGTASDAKVERHVAAVTSFLTDMIKRQTAVRKDTQACADQSTKVGRTLVDGQDALAGDVTEFIRRCREEAAAVKGSDVTFGALLENVAIACGEMKVREAMTMAAAHLDDNKPKEAMPPEDDALTKLKDLLAKLDEVKTKEEAEEEKELLAAVQDAKERFEKLAAAQRKALEGMEMVGNQKDKSTKDTDLMEEEYEEMLKNMEEALLQVPTDLHIFMDLNVANDIVEDVFSVFEEVRQQEGSEDLKAGDVKERALAKREEYLEKMEEAKGRLDGLENWLADKPDDTKITAEAFDKAEMPQAGIALGALSTEAEDLIGDLLDKDKEMSDKADDGAINTSVPDMAPNAEVKEGDVASFAAQGASGNETPDHKEQDGRSNVGRQGMAVGETSAGSGTINEGDKNIEARRTQEPTQSGQVDVEGEDVKTKATGGGKLGTGKADDFGMEGGVKRMDSTEAGSREGLDALMARRADALYAKASMQSVRTDSLKNAAHHLRQAADAIARGQISQVRELRKSAVAELRAAKSQIDATAAGTFGIEQTSTLLDDVVEGGPDQAPPKYRDSVAEYYKALNHEL